MAGRPVLRLRSARSPVGIATAAEFVTFCRACGCSRGRGVLRSRAAEAGNRLHLKSVYTVVFHVVQFSWDPAKSDATLRRRGFDFEFACQIFGGDIVETEDRRRDYGERRMVAIGLADGIHLTVGYTDRTLEGGAIRRIISARRSNANERQIYARQADPDQDPYSRSR